MKPTKKYRTGLLVVIAIVLLAGAVAATIALDRQRQIRNLQAAMVDHAIEASIQLEVGSTERDRGRYFLAAMELTRLQGVLESNFIRGLGVDDRNTFCGSVEDLSNLLIFGRETDMRTYIAATDRAVPVSDEEAFIYGQMSERLRFFALSLCEPNADVVSARSQLLQNCNKATIEDAIFTLQMDFQQWL